MTTKYQLFIFVNIIYFVCIIQTVNGEPPIRLPVSTRPSSTNSTCPLRNDITEERTKVRETLLDYYNRSLLCPCGIGTRGSWTRVAYLNMSDTNQQCPANWSLTTSPVRGCGRRSTGWRSCDSVIYPVNGNTYTSVCGRINAYQRGHGNAFYNQINNIESDYVSGVSITHGRPGSRQHIWTFAASLSYDCTAHVNHFCPCTNINVNWPYQVPSFIGNDYFCESGRKSSDRSCSGGSAYYPGDPLWDGKGCPSTSTCCELNSPPWFCKTLPNPTSDDLELRQCHVNGGTFEDTLVSLIEIYVK